jgi:hypothetical protein
VLARSEFDALYARCLEAVAAGESPPCINPTDAPAAAHAASGDCLEIINASLREVSLFLKSAASETDGHSYLVLVNLTDDELSVSTSPWRDRCAASLCLLGSEAAWLRSTVEDLLTRCV